MRSTHRSPWLGVVLIILSAQRLDSADEAIQFSEHLIASGYAYPYGIAAADYDGDGDLDLSSADYQPHNTLILFENDGNGNFTQSFIQKNDARRLERHVAGDLNGDGLLDIVIVKNLYGHLLWFENPGPARIKELWRRYVLTTELPGAYSVDLADVDGDGDLDVAASSWVLGNQFAWFENDGTPGDGEWKKHNIETGVAETRSIRFADFDGDGDADLFGSAPGAGRAMWYEQVNAPAGGSTRVGWKKHVIVSGPRPMHGDPIDMDGDGDVDVVLAMGMAARGDGGSQHVSWFENKGDLSAEVWERHVIDSEFRDAFEARARDMDSDGDIDVVATSWRHPGSVAWFENRGSSWQRHLLKNNWRSADNVLIADLNGDDRPDIVAVAEHTSYELRWWRNEGLVAPVRSVAESARRVTQTIAHQGAKAKRPANTLAAIRLGMESGVTAVEVDVRTTRDGALIVRHDSTLDKTTDGSGLVKDHTLAELRQLDAGSWFDPQYADERIPTLREALELCHGKVYLMLDLKEQDAAFNEKLAAEVQAYGDRKRLIFGVRTATQARQLRSLVSQARQLGLIPGPDMIEEFVAAGVQTIRLRRASSLDPKILARLRAQKVGFHLGVGLGTEAEVREKLALGPDSLSADDPELLVQTLTRLRGDLVPVISVEQLRPSLDELRAARRRAAHKKRRIIMNNDGNDCRNREPGTPRTTEAFLAQRATPLVGSQVDAIFYCTGGFNLYRHHTRGVTELQKVGGKGDEDWGWELGYTGPDVLAGMVSFGHRQGIEVFWSMRMNDTHDAKYPHAMSQWKRDNPECLVGQKGQTFEYGRCRWKGRWSSLDYSHPKVRDKAFQILRDVARRYDVDGLELDFFRHPIYFKPQMTGEPVTQAHRDIMTGFLRRVREMTETEAYWRGRPLLIAVRVPDSVGYCKAIGLDLERWLDEGLIDMVTGGGYFHLEPWENLVALGRRYDVPVYAGLSASRLGFPALPGDRFNRREVVGIELWRGEAARAWEAGVSGIYVFNCFNPRDTIFREIGDPKVLAGLEKTYVPKVGAIDQWVKGGEQFVKLPGAKE